MRIVSTSMSSLVKSSSNCAFFKTSFFTFLPFRPLGTGADNPDVEISQDNCSSLRQITFSNNFNHENFMHTTLAPLPKLLRQKCNNTVIQNQARVGNDNLRKKYFKTAATLRHSSLLINLQAMCMHT